MNKRYLAVAVACEDNGREPFLLSYKSDKFDNIAETAIKTHIEKVYDNDERYYDCDIYWYDLEQLQHSSLHDVDTLRIEIDKREEEKKNARYQEYLKLKEEFEE